MTRRNPDYLAKEVNPRMPMNDFDEHEPLPFEGHMLLITVCCRCGIHPLVVDPDHAVSVLIHQATGTPVDPDGNPARRGDPLVQREALCPACVQLCRQAIAEGKPVSWPRRASPPGGTGSA